MLMYKYNFIGTYKNKNHGLLCYKNELLEIEKRFNKLNANSRNQKQIEIKKISDRNIIIILYSFKPLDMPNKSLELFNTLCKEFLKFKKGIFHFEPYSDI